MSGNGPNDPWFKSSSTLPLHAMSSGCRTTLSELRGRNRADEERWSAMNVLLAPTKPHVWTRAVQDFKLTGRAITSGAHRPPPVEQGRVRPRHYPPRSCSYLDDDLMNREMYDHLREEPIRLTSPLTFRLRRS